jgi:hypothetical protein
MSLDSHASHNRCVSFRPAVIDRTCNTRYRAARYALPGRDFHPLERASFSWRTRCYRTPRCAIASERPRAAHDSDLAQFAAIRAASAGQPPLPCCVRRTCSRFVGLYRIGRIELPTSGSE